MRGKMGYNEQNRDYLFFSICLFDGDALRWFYYYS